MTAWLRGAGKPVGRKAWLEDWAASGWRPETKHLACAFTDRGFDHSTGRQWHPKSATALAKDAGVTGRTAERFLAKARNAGRLTYAGRRVLRPGMQSTPLYQLTTPGHGHGRPFLDLIPTDVREELLALCEWDEAALALSRQASPWVNPKSPPKWISPEVSETQGEPVDPVNSVY